ncbi:MAG: hypothetical protein ACYC91_06870 [Solirubrobacteraceae bacterium]
MARAADYSGQVATPLGNCPYAVSADGGGWSAMITCRGALSATASGSYDTHQLTIDSVDVTTPLGERSVPVGLTLELPEDVSQAAQTVAFWKDAARGVAEQAVANQAQQYVADVASDITKVFGFDSVDVALNDHCESLDFSSASLLCRKLPNSPPTGYGIESVGAGEAPSEAQACPPLAEKPPTQVFVVCAPTVLMGTLDTGSKPILVLPGGALLTLGFGPTTGLFEPTLKTSGSIVFVGGALSGTGVRLQAGGNIQFAASALGTAGPIVMSARGRVDIGRFDLSSLPSLVEWALGELDVLIPVPSIGADRTLYDGLRSGIAQASAALGKKHGTLPAVVDAPRVTIDAKAGSVESGSLLATDGLGGPGATFSGDGRAVGGASQEFGGSHGGYGGFPINVDSRDAYQTLGGRGPAYDDPFDPREPGNGGAGISGDAAGLSGGGVVRATLTGDFTVNGRIEANGDGAGRCGICGDHGGGGAGGAINLRAATLDGSGTVAADGGGFCAQCGNGGGGLGGGGRIAVRYVTDRFHGQIHAWGGSDVQYPRNRFDLSALDGRGGAGTLYLLQHGQTGRHKPRYPGGTLIIDGGGGAYPAADGTPISSGLSAPGRELIVRNGARVYASKLAVGHLAVQNGGEITTAPGAAKLVLGANLLDVARGARIDVNGRGYRGGLDADIQHGEAGVSAPGVLPATVQYGGSHGGFGGVPPSGSTGHRGDTYDSIKSPRLPGAGGAGYDANSADDGTSGGGVLTITATAVNLAGALLSDGQDGPGPNLLDWSVLNLNAGAGAGGSIQLRTHTFAGGGTVAADGGSLCPPVSFLIAGVSCSGSGGGPGGGGRIAVYAERHTGFRGKLQALGGVNTDVPAPNNRGGKGTVYHGWH